MTTPAATPVIPSAKKHRRWPWIVGGVVLFFIAVGSCSDKSGTPTNYSGSPVLTPSVQAPAPVLPTGPVTSIGDGTFEVGTGAGQVPAGTYRTTGPDSSNPMGCYFEREKDTSGDSIITNDITKGPTVVTIAATDGAFKSSGCAAWTKTR